MKHGSVPELRRVNRKAAMPEVQKLVKKFGLTAVGSCIGILREQAKARKAVERVKLELAELEKRARG